ncbi:hypothetical protein [Psychromonas algicola]|uniref:hypothetical protein n=1 Tax=Psychromonas algicola TaxID=2555642 RepID=UPI0010681FA0|nr:hypothetical protein [Psychromonas sp. RZ5]TEW50624.1 hypothetical protein E2R67_09110 [Psychromonas sp. RZ5]
MNIKVSVGKKSTTIRWQYLGEQKFLRLLGLVSAQYSTAKKVIITMGCDGKIRQLGLDGEQISEFSFCNSDHCRFYTLAASIVSELGVCAVMGHTPELNGERFWQHEIDFEKKELGPPVSKWR